MGLTVGSLAEEDSADFIKIERDHPVIKANLLANPNLSNRVM
jgi:hypothetical protein